MAAQYSAVAFNDNADRDMFHGSDPRAPSFASSNQGIELPSRVASTDRLKSSSGIGGIDVRHHSLGGASLRSQRSTVSQWRLELLSLLLSVVSFVAVIVVLALQDGKPLSQWAFPASINTVISVLGAVSRTCLAFAVSACIGQQKWNWLRIRKDELRAFEMFDDASRGPWGGLKLLWWLKGR